MNKVKQFFKQKSIGFYFNLATLIFMIIAVICFSQLIKVSEIMEEQPAAVIALCIVAVLISIAAGYKDWFRALTIAELVFVSATFFLFIGGRVSYLAYYFSGDIMGTGLSPLFILSAVFMVIALVASILAICFKQEKSVSTEINN